jgi:hypothetical protein
MRMHFPSASSPGHHIRARVWFTRATRGEPARRRAGAVVRGEAAAAEQSDPHRPEEVGRHGVEVRSAVARERNGIAPGDAHFLGPRRREGERRAERRGLYARQRPGRVQQAPVHGRDPGGVVVGAAGVDADGEHAVHVHAHRQLADAVEAAQEQAGPDE